MTEWTIPVNLQTHSEVKFEFEVCRGTKGVHARRVGFILPSQGFLDHLRSTPLEYEYHFLISNYDKDDCMGFNADAFASICIEYCKDNRIEGCFGFDCFPSFIASIINTKLSLPGASSLSIAMCTNKYYLRKYITPDIHVFPIFPLRDKNPQPPTAFPFMIKGCDSQYYIETRLIRNLQQWNAYMQRIRSNGDKLEHRKRFYHKYVPEFASRWEDVVLYHVEPIFHGKEHQIEFCMDTDSNPVICDTGDVVKQNGIVSGFQTPGSFDFNSEIKAFIADISSKMKRFGCKNQVLDCEFILSPGGIRLIEFNSRYSFMAWKDLDGKIRNLENLSQASLGLPLRRIPIRDTPEFSILGFYIYSNVLAPITDTLGSQINHEQIRRWEKDRQIELFWKPIYDNKGYIEKEDLIFNQKYAKLAYITLTRRVDDWKNWEEEIHELSTKIFNENVGIDPILMTVAEPHSVPFNVMCTRPLAKL